MKRARSGSVDWLEGRQASRWQALTASYLEFLDSPILAPTTHSNLTAFEQPIYAVRSDTRTSFFPFPTETEADRVVARLPVPIDSFQASLISLATLPCQVKLSQPLCAELARVMCLGGWVGGIVPASTLIPATLATFIDDLPEQDRLGQLLQQTTSTYHEGFSERHLTSLLLESGLRFIRTAEALNGLLLYFKARR